MDQLTLQENINLSGSSCHEIISPFSPYGWDQTSFISFWPLARGARSLESRFVAFTSRTSQGTNILPDSNKTLLAKRQRELCRVCSSRYTSLLLLPVPRKGTAQKCFHNSTQEMLRKKIVSKLCKWQEDSAIYITDRSFNGKNWRNWQQ